LRQIVANLAENAVKFTDEGYVLVEAWLVHDGPGSPPGLEVRVIDSGTGISAEAQTRIFDRFEQGDSSTTRRKGGTGLGLHIVKLLVGALGGDVRLRSVPGSGADFTVRIPIEPVREPASDRRNDKPARSLQAGARGGAPGRVRVLVAEDTEANFAVLELYLLRAGYDVMRARDGRAAVTTAIQGCDLVLMDVEMPEMDGLEATRTIRQAEAELGRPPVPIIALTAHAIQGYRERCLSAGCTSYLSKPVRKAALLEAITLVLDDVQDAVPAPSAATPAVRPVVTVDPELAELVPEFLAYCQTEQIRIQDAADRGDWATAARLGHGLKGAGPAVGFHAVGGFGRDIETAARAGDSGLIRRSLAELADHLGHVHIVTGR
ncbi:MAG: ATP-binding protein, partial [Vicinamibacterales bacterium]|nr:ATP-binding protein [Vicinamibacterales bacterium]